MNIILNMDLKLITNLFNLLITKQKGIIAISKREMEKRSDLRKLNPHLI